MPAYEYKAVPAPSQGLKAKGVKSTEERFALALSDALNHAAADGWEYVRAETLPCDERRGLTGTQTTYQNVLIYRRPRAVVSNAASGQVERSEQSLPPLALGQPTRAPLQARRDPPLRGASDQGEDV